MTGQTRTIAALDKAERKLTIDLGDNFADERIAILRIVAQALDILEGKRRSVVPVERFAISLPAEGYTPFPATALRGFLGEVTR